MTQATQGLPVILAVKEREGGNSNPNMEPPFSGWENLFGLEIEISSGRVDKFQDLQVVSNEEAAREYLRRAFWPAFRESSDQNRSMPRSWDPPKEVRGMTEQILGFIKKRGKPVQLLVYSWGKGVGVACLKCPQKQP